MEDKPALDPCPFCGSAMESFAGMYPDAFAKGPGTFAVNCECGAIGPPGPGMEQAVAEWNIRSDCRESMSDEDEAYIIATAKKHDGQYLLTRADWINEADPYRQACERLVRAGRARWLGVKRPGEPGEPGPGIRLVGRDAAES